MAFKILNPLHLHAAGHTEDPKDPKKKYGKVTVKKEKKGNTTTVTATRPYSTSRGGKDLGKDFKPTKAQTDKANKARRSTGSDTRSITVVDKKQIGAKKLSTTPKPKINLKAKLTKPSNITVGPSIPGRKKKIKKPTNRINIRGKSCKGNSFKPGCLTD